MESTLGFALIRQKDHILQLIYDQRYEEALALLDFTAEVWKLDRYDYKTRELRNIIKGEVREKLMVCAHWKQHQKWRAMYDKIVVC